MSYRVEDEVQLIEVRADHNVIAKEIESYFKNKAFNQTLKNIFSLSGDSKTDHRTFGNRIMIRGA